MQVDFVCHTSGTGLWSTKKAAVPHRELRLSYLDDEDGLFGELQVVFGEEWNVATDGLIYTDPQWESELRTALVSLGLTTEAAADVGYSEQGMQGEDYVSLDVSGGFFSGDNPLVKQLIGELNAAG